MRDEKFIRIHQNPFIAYIVSHEDKMWEYMTFGPYITSFCQLTLWVDTSYISGIWTECSISVFITKILMNTVLVGFILFIEFKA